MSQGGRGQITRQVQSFAMQDEMGEHQHTLERTMSQRPLEFAEGQASAPKQCLEPEGMDISWNGEDEGREPSLRLSCINSSNTRAEMVLLGSDLNDAKL